MSLIMIFGERTSVELHLLQISGPAQICRTNTVGVGESKYHFEFQFRTCTCDSLTDRVTVRCHSAGTLCPQSLYRSIVSRRRPAAAPRADPRLNVRSEPLADRNYKLIRTQGRRDNIERRQVNKTSERFNECGR